MYSGVYSLQIKLYTYPCIDCCMCLRCFVDAEANQILNCLELLDVKLGDFLHVVFVDEL